MNISFVHIGDNYQTNLHSGTGEFRIRRIRLKIQDWMNQTEDEMDQIDDQVDHIQDEMNQIEGQVHNDEIPQRRDWEVSV